ncbi:MAG: type I DNA topoisomerase [Dysgonamonadaceae bacterium]|jgi:DNA topoisomerase-1|nr:type I DNA topoisomerase [Dysgonamonadaceae bacterium]
MQKNLVIVESPAKAKTIEKFLGEGYKVLSSYGHVRDLKIKDGIDVKNNYRPTYVVSDDKKELVNKLKKEAKSATMVWLASDEDREGEAISWHLFETLNLDKKKTKRIVFHEITQTAIQQAIEHPRGIDYNLVDAQQARRVLDRIVGFELSPILWKKIKPALSAGRVQSVAVRLIVDREREINQFHAEASYRVQASFQVPGESVALQAELGRRVKTKEEVLALLEQLKDAVFTIEDIAKKPVKKSPAAPFTTSTLQQEAARKLGFSVSQTMMVAQRLYESGHITYMRTDSVNLSSLAINTSKSEIISAYGEKYLKTRQFQTKSKGAQEAHEAIRPTYMSSHTVKATVQEQKLYELIWKRTIASQMADAELERTTVSIGISNNPKDKFQSVGEVIKFDGFLHVYLESSDEELSEEETSIIPPLKIKAELPLNEAIATERFTQRPPRYSEASLVRKMEELGIGRPSTYAPTISTIQNREYVVKGDKPGHKRSFSLLTLKDGLIKDQIEKETTGADKAKLMPTDIGIVVNDFLAENFPSILDYSFTANVEKEFDDVAEGLVKWTKTIDDFYKIFHPIVEQTAAAKTEYKVGERVLGNDPASGRLVFVKIGRYGPLVQIGHADDEEKPLFASLLKGQSIETITLEEALKLFELPRKVGELNDKPVTAAIGRFGPFVRHDNKFVSIPKGLDPFTISIEDAIRLIDEKRLREAQKVIKTFENDPETQLLNGRYGPYIASSGVNYKLPKDRVPIELTYEEIMEIVKDSSEKKPKRKVASKTEAKAKPKTKPKTASKAKTKVKTSKTKTTPKVKTA